MITDEKMVVSKKRLKSIADSVTIIHHIVNLVYLLLLCIICYTTVESYIIGKFSVTHSVVNLVIALCLYFWLKFLNNNYSISNKKNRCIIEHYDELKKELEKRNGQ